jgi:hypothetical protein
LLSIRSANKEYMCFNITLLFHILLLELHVLLIRMKNISSNNFSMNLKIYETLWKESLNSDDGHQFHLYQQNVQSPLILTELTEHKKITTCDIGNPCSFKEYITFLNRLYYITWFGADYPWVTCSKPGYASIWSCRWRMNMLTTSQYQPRLSSIINVDPGGSANQIAVFTSKLIQIIINRFVFFKQVELASRLCKCGVWSRK